MGAREAFRSIGRRSRAIPCGLGVGAIVLTGCGGDDDFENAPRPAAPIVVTAKVDDRKVVVSPDEFGAGLVNFTVSNQSDDPVNLTLIGPAPESNIESGEVPPGGVGNVKTDVVEGEYEVTGGDRSDARATRVQVGPPRASSSDELLLP